MRKFLLITILICLCSLTSRGQWNYTIPVPQSLQPEDDTVSMVMIGDVMMHARQLEYDFTTFFEKMRHILSDADVTIANMEFTLAGEPYSGYPSFSAPDGYARYMAECGTDIFLTANNHILDKGSAGLVRTLGIYDGMEADGIRYTGTGLSEQTFESHNPLFFVCRGIRFAIVNFTYGTNTAPDRRWPKTALMDRDEVAEAMKKARDRNVDFIIAMPHWGDEYQLRHNARQQDWAEWLVSEGADLIVGAHPHVVQDTTHISGVPVVFSMGNAVSNMSARNTRLELAVRGRFVSKRDGSKEMLEPELIFLWCTLPGTLTESYATIPVGEWMDRRGSWLDPSDYDNMTDTYKRVIQSTSIYEENH